MAMCDILFGEDYLKDHAVVTGNCNGNSPLLWDATMLGAMRAFVKRRQPVLCSPFVLGGANTPASTVPAVVQLNAEALSALAYTQVVGKGAPAIYGHYLSTVSMQSGAPTFGTPESSKLIMGAAQLARRLDVPFRSGGSFCASKLPDAQAASESANSLMSTLLAGVNFVLHAAGWMEGGLCSSYEKFVMDADQLGMMHVLAQGIATDDASQAMDAMTEVGPGGHFLGCEHTQTHFKSAFYNSSIADNNSFEQWKAEGSLDTMQRANGLWKKQLADYEEPALDPGIDEELLDFMARRKLHHQAS